MIKTIILLLKRYCDRLFGWLDLRFNWAWAPLSLPYTNRVRGKAGREGWQRSGNTACSVDLRCFFYRFIGAGKLFFGFFYRFIGEKYFAQQNCIALLDFFSQKMCNGIALIDTFLSIAAHLCP